MNHSFDIEVAREYGITVAVFLNNIAYWTTVNMANRRNYHDDRYWIYNTRKAFTELFPYWTEDQLRTISKKAKKHDLLIESNYNKHGYDKTIWYSLTDKALNIYKLYPVAPDKSDEPENDANPSPASCGKNTTSSPASLVENPTPNNKPETEQIDNSLVDNGLQPTPSLMWEKSQMEVGKIPNGSGKNPKPIPNGNPDNKTYTTTVSEQKLYNTDEANPEPVVVSLIPSLTPSHEYFISAKSDERIIAAYKINPITKNNIWSVEDCLSACKHWIDFRPKDVAEEGRMKMLVKFIINGEFEEPADWSSNITKDRNARIAEQNLKRNEDASLAAVKELLANTKIDLSQGRDSLRAVKDALKADIQKVPSYAEKRNPIKFAKLPEKVDYIETNFMWDENSVIEPNQNIGSANG